MPGIKAKWQQYIKWQKNPYQVAPMSDTAHVCSTCSTDFIGNYCPRCGQSAMVKPKMSFIKTILLFLDVWGLGNRGMFRTLRDLIFRPGYMICDYLRGMHNAYFPPFKMLFLLTTLSLLIGHGWNIKRENFINDFKKEEKAIEATENNAIKEIESDLTLTKEQEEEDLIFLKIEEYSSTIVDFQKDYPALYELVFMLFTSCFFYILFWKSKNIGNLLFHEFFIAMIYTVNMVNIYDCIMRFFAFPEIFIMLSGVLYIIPLKQMSGYSWFKTILRYVSSLLLALFTFFGVAMIIYIIYCLKNDIPFD